MRLAEIRSFAFTLPEVTEQPHFQYTSLRVRGKIFATMPLAGGHLHLFVSEHDREVALTLGLKFLEKLLWGGKVVGVRVNLADARPPLVKELLRQAWEYRAPKALAPARPPTSVESRIATFVARYTPEIAGQLRDARARLQALFPRGCELVHDNYNALVFGFGPTKLTSGALVSIAGYPDQVTLFFLKGAELADPKGLLQGQGGRVRNIQLESPADIDTPAIRSLISQAVKPHRAEFAEAPPRTTIIKSVSAKQRPRRPPKPSATARRPRGVLAQG